MKLLAAVIVLVELSAAVYFGYTRLRPSPPPATKEVSAPDPRDGAMTIARLADQRPAIRRQALEALGPSRDACLDEDLLPLLHDPEAEIRSRCEELLRARGLSDKEIQV